MAVKLKMVLMYSLEKVNTKSGIIKDREIKDRGIVTCL